jgi:chromosome segregation ATPase
MTSLLQTLVLIALGALLTEIYGRLIAKLSSLEIEVGALQTQLAILQKSQNDIVVEKENNEKETECLRYQLERWRERDQEEKLTLIRSIGSLAGQIEQDRERVAQAEEKAVGKDTVKKFEQVLAHRRSQVIRKQVSIGGFDMEGERDRRRRELEGKIHPALRNKDSGFGHMDADSDVDADVTNTSVSELNFDNGSDGSITGKNYLLGGRGLRRRRGMIFY